MIAAEHPDRLALRIVADGDATAQLSYGELAARSSQVANWLSDLGARRGDRLLLMLGNIAPLWEVILASIKLGAVISPASTLLPPTPSQAPASCPTRWTCGRRRYTAPRGQSGASSTCPKPALRP